MKGQITSVMCLGKSESSLYTGMLQGSKYGIQLLKLLIYKGNQNGQSVGFYDGYHFINFNRLSLYYSSILYFLIFQFYSIIKKI